MRRRLACSSLLLVLSCGCGKKGPPLPPLHRIAQAPAEFVAERRANRAELEFTVPDANTDGTRPASISQVHIYALNSPAPVPPEQVVATGTRVASVDVKGPRNSDDVIGPDDPAEDLEPLEGPGLDQGIKAHVVEELVTMAPTPASGPLRRIYVGVGVTRNGRRGLLSQVAAVPLGPAPPAPAAPTVTYNEARISVVWTAAGRPGTAYQVYEPGAASEAGAKAAAGAAGDVRLTATPLTEALFADERIEWGAKRCYSVRMVEIVDDLRAESEASLPVCVTLVDTFAPATPTGFETSPTQGAVSLVWDANKEKDLAGYLVLRADSLDAPLTPITPAPIPEPNFTDTVASGVRRTYAIRAVDKAGNLSAPTARKEEAAR